jgi:drug/metabolite transporter (DMT)-like permease
MITMLPTKYKGILYALIGYTSFSVADVCVKYLSASYSIYQIITIETFFGVLALLALSSKLGGFGDLWARENRVIHGIRAVLNFFINLVFVMAVSLLPIATVYTFVFAKPFLVAVIAIPLFGQIPGKNRWIAIGLGFVGILVALRPGTVAFDPDLIYPMVITVLISIMFLISNSLRPGTSIFSLGIYPIAGSFIMTLPFMVFHYTPVEMMDLPLFILAGFAATSGVVFVSLAFRTIPAALASPFMYTQMIWGILFGYLIFSDWPEIWTLVGAGIIIASGLYLVTSERRPFNDKEL